MSKPWSTHYMPEMRGGTRAYGFGAMPEHVDRVALVAVRDSRAFGLQVLLKANVAAAGVGKAGTSLPCGDVEMGDCVPPTLERCCGVAAADAQRLIGHERKPAEALGYWVAATRLLLGATGLLFVVSDGQHTSVPQTLPLHERRLPAQDAPALADYLTRRDLYCDISRLHFFSRWIDVRTGDLNTLFLVRIPDSVFVKRMFWRAPDKVLISWRNQQLGLDFESFAALRVLADFSSCESLLSGYVPP